MTDQAKPREWWINFGKRVGNSDSPSYVVENPHPESKDIYIRVIEHSAYLRLEKERDQYAKEIASLKSIEMDFIQSNADLQKRLAESEAEVSQLMFSVEVRNINNIGMTNERNEAQVACAAAMKSSERLGLIVCSLEAQVRMLEEALKAECHCDTHEGVRCVCDPCEALSRLKEIRGG